VARIENNRGQFANIYLTAEQVEDYGDRKQQVENIIIRAIRRQPLKILQIQRK
jgi:hypothetical protein